MDYIKILKEILDAVIYFIFPSRCPVCREFVDERYQLCESCTKNILRLNFCDNPPTQIEKVLRITKYRDGTRELLHKLKFENDLDVLPIIKKILNDSKNREDLLSFMDNIDLAVPVPIHNKRFKERGFNQTDLMFNEWLTQRGIPLKNILSRTRPTPRLYKFNRLEREEILNGAFTAIENINLVGKNILIVDDIFTTGSTVNECAKVLKSLGAEKIFVIAFASNFNERD